MAGSFKSMVWDYYLPTDMHEASFIIQKQTLTNTIGKNTHIKMNELKSM